MDCPVRPRSEHPLVHFSPNVGREPSAPMDLPARLPLAGPNWQWWSVTQWLSQPDMAPSLAGRPRCPALNRRTDKGEGASGQPSMFFQHLSAVIADEQWQAPASGTQRQTAQRRGEDTSIDWRSDKLRMKFVLRLAPHPRFQGARREFHQGTDHAPVRRNRDWIFHRVFLSQECLETTQCSL